MSQTTEDHLQVCLTALEFRNKMRNLACQVRSISESDYDTLRRAVTMVGVLAQIRDEVARPAYDDRPSHTREVFTMLRPILENLEKSLELLDEYEKKYLEREREEHRRNSGR